MYWAGHEVCRLFPVRYGGRIFLGTGLVSSLIRWSLQSPFPILLPLPSWFQACQWRLQMIFTLQRLPGTFRSS